jgi:Ca2+-binding RTX toxin-like protein
LAKHVIADKDITGWTIQNGGDTWIVGRYGSIKPPENPGYGIRVLAANTNIVVDGFVSGSNGSAPIVSDAIQTHIEIGATGVLFGTSNAIELNDANATIINRGTIYGTVISFVASARIENFGYMNDGMFINGNGTLINQKSGVVHSNSSFILSYSDVGDHVEIINHGTIAGVMPGEYAIYGRDGQEIVVNTHDFSGGVGLGDSSDRFTSVGTTIHGDVDAGEGNDRIDLRNSTLAHFRDGYGGAVFGDDGNDVFDLRGTTLFYGAGGGRGNDTYIVNDRAIKISETPASGTDTVKSFVSFSLAENFENLILMGSSRINGTGNTLDNTLTGNTADNVLKGGAGEDLLDGGRGTDKLFGGTGADTFGFATGYGKDTVGDFRTGDKVYVHNWKAVDNFSDIKSHASNHGTNVWITVGSDTLIMENLHKADLNAGDFQF